VLIQAYYQDQAVRQALLGRVAADVVQLVLEGARTSLNVDLCQIKVPIVVEKVVQQVVEVSVQ